MTFRVTPCMTRPSASPRTTGTRQSSATTSRMYTARRTSPRVSSFSRRFRCGRASLLSSSGASSERSARGRPPAGRLQLICGAGHKVRPFFWQPMNSAPASTTPAAATPGTPPLRELLRLRRFAEVLAAVPAVLQQSPADREALLCQAIAQRYLGQIPAAFRTLATLEQHHPRFGRLYEERGRCFVELRQAPQAIEAFLTAVHFNHALPGSWEMLEGLYRMQGDRKNAATAASHVATLRSLPQEVVIATGLF